MSYLGDETYSNPSRTSTIRKYVKFIDNLNIQYATNPIINNNMMISNPTDEILTELGYKELRNTTMPNDLLTEEDQNKYYYQSKYRERDSYIEQYWVKMSREVEGN